MYLSFHRKSTTQSQSPLIASGELRPTTKPDLDNLVKGIKDGCTKIIWHDDAQIVEMVVRKFYDMQPRAEVKVKVLSI
ncbi:RusA family crossover junction endodeoxyribonuclease [Solibacillus sp. R5-41]|uniref:RusA family crossover junction endodeoxyribonuclease n=1 Tax=Solibacillus sp. R5-41 TaxID=2048654 RepID=UPI0020A3C02D|nr:RusA family crossover junction endodeoxyribonuclease [Solibacillus sp. R5-41]